jgi:hypothetical protein
MMLTFQQMAGLWTIKALLGTLDSVNMSMPPRSFKELMYFSSLVMVLFCVHHGLHYTGFRNAGQTQKRDKGSSVCSFQETSFAVGGGTCELALVRESIFHTQQPLTTGGMHMSHHV